MTRRTQIGLLTTASVLCCAGVFLGARLSNGSHASLQEQKPTVADATPSAPMPVSETPKKEPTIGTNMDDPLSPPPALSPVPEFNDTRAKAEPESLPPLPPPADLTAKRPAPSSAITLVRADEPVANTKSAADEGSILPPTPNVDSSTPIPSDLPPPPPPKTKDGPSPSRTELPELSAPGDQFTPAPVKQASVAPKELTGKTAIDSASPHATGPTPAIAPLPSDNLPPPSAPAHVPSSQDAVIQIKTGRNPVDVGSPSRLEKADVPPPSIESGPPARIVPVSPPTSATPQVAVTPVLKKQSTVTKAKVLPLTGTHACKLDEKSGLTLPKAVREQMGEQETLFVTLGSDHCVWLTTAAGLEKLTDRLEKSPAVEDEAKVARRRYFAQTERIAVDKNGYFVIPAGLLESVGLKQDAVLIGVGDHLELWDVQRWHKYSQTPTAEPDAGAAERRDEL